MRTPKAPKIVLPASLKAEGKVVIVGGGPAGCHMATLLAKKGCKNILILEAEEALGGKSYTVNDPVEGVKHEMGTCYLHALYEPILKLKRRYDPNNDLVAIGGVSRKAFAADERGGDDASYLKGKVFTEYVLEKAYEATSLPRGCCTWLTWIGGGCGFLTAVQRYASVHRKIFGRYKYGLPPQPKVWELCDMTGMEFLEKYDLKELEGFLRYAQEVQGYGTLEQVHAFYMLWWIHPTLLKKTVNSVIRNKPSLWLLQRGFQQLWQSMVRVHDDAVKVETGAKVTMLARDPHSVSYEKKDGSVQTVYADYIVMALDLSRFAGVAVDLDIKEQPLFSPDCFQSTTLCTTLYEADHAGSHENAVELWFGRILPNPATGSVEGRLYAHRNSRLTVALGDVQSNGVGRKVQPSLLEGNDGRQRRVAYQYLDRPLDPAVDPDVLKNQLLSDLDNVGEKNFNVMLQKPWPYSPKFTADALKEGRPWQVLALQGHRNTLWIGSSVCFESVLDCVVYNDKLAKAMVFSKPKKA